MAEYVGSSFHAFSVSTSTCLPTQKLSEACILGNLMETSPCRHGRQLTQSLVSLSFLDDVWLGGKAQGSNHGLVFWGTSPHYETIQEPTKNHPIRPKDTPVTQKI